MSSQASGASIVKRQKLHPLRQTSFPVSAGDNGYNSALISARSETGSIPASAISATSSKRTPTGRGRGRPRKSTQIAPEDLPISTRNGDTTLQTSGLSTTGRTNGTVISSRSANNAPGDASDDDEDLGHETTERTNAEKEYYERKRLNELTLLHNLSELDQYRHEKWRNVKLDGPTLKKMVNATVSQSITKRPLEMVGFYAKWFVGEVVEGARVVQVEWAKGFDKWREEERERRKVELERLRRRQSEGVLGEGLEVKMLMRNVSRLEREVEEYIPNPHGGALLPEHLRESLRRYKAGGEGGGMGFEGQSHGLLGDAGGNVWKAGDGAGGRRLFR